MNLTEEKIKQLEKKRRKIKLSNNKSKSGFMSFGSWYVNTPSIHLKSTSKCVNIASNMKFSDSEEEKSQEELFLSSSSEENSDSDPEVVLPLDNSQDEILADLNDESPSFHSKRVLEL